MPEKAYRSGRVALVGRPNVGKSTLLNALTGENIAIISPHPQTTRQRLLGVVTTEHAQVAFVDTPGLHAPRHRLGVRMQNEAREAVREADLVALLVDGTAKSVDTPLLEELPQARLCVVNKVDLVRPKSLLLPRLEAWSRAREFEAIIPISARTGSGVEVLLQEIIARLPEGPPLYEPDMLTDKPERFLVAEVVREQILVRTRQEVPHGVAVTVDEFEEGKRGARVTLTVHVVKESHKKIIVGKAGALLKEVGMAAREKLSGLLGRPVHLRVWVRVTPDWVDTPQALEAGDAS